MKSQCFIFSWSAVLLVFLRIRVVSHTGKLDTLAVSHPEEVDTGCFSVSVHTSEMIQEFITRAK